MKIIKYFFEFIFIIFFFIIFKIIGYKNASNLGEKIGRYIGPLFRSNHKIQSNLKNSNVGNTFEERKDIIKKMWGNYGRIFAEYMYIKEFRNNKLLGNIEIVGEKILDEIKNKQKPVIFVSGHFNNFELMAMYLEKSGIKLSAIYRPLNNIFLNKIMETIRKKYICRNQIKKGIGGLKKLIELKKNNYSSALMIDQRVSEGIFSPLFNKRALTTTIPAQLVKRFNIPIVPVYIERIKGLKFKIIINQPLFFSQDASQQEITDDLNQILEKFILSKPANWIWSHNRWK